jgi:hypothetical protein
VLEIGSKSCLKKAIKGAILFQKLAELFGWTGRKALTGPGNTAASWQHWWRLIQTGQNGSKIETVLKVVGNEKVGGSRRWHMIDIGLGPW